MTNNPNSRKPTARELVAAKQVKRPNRVAGEAAGDRLAGAASDDRGRRPGHPSVSGAVSRRGGPEPPLWAAYQVRQERKVRHP